MGLATGDAVGLADGSGELTGDRDGGLECDIVGIQLGDMLGDADSGTLGDGEGIPLGAADGDTGADGCDVGGGAGKLVGGAAAGTTRHLSPFRATHRGATQLPLSTFASASGYHCRTAAPSRVPGKAGWRHPRGSLWQCVGQLTKKAAWRFEI